MFRKPMKNRFSPIETNTTAWLHSGDNPFFALSSAVHASGSQFNEKKLRRTSLGYPRIRIFKAILSDWISRHSSRNRQQMAEVDIARRAMDEFISRHQNTFLP
jgi:hypothetical protein